MAPRWCAAGMLEAGHQFRRVNGHLHVPKLRATLNALGGIALADLSTGAVGACQRRSQDRRLAGWWQMTQGATCWAAVHPR